MHELSITSCILSHHPLGPAIVVEAVMAKGLSPDLQGVASPEMNDVGHQIGDLVTNNDLI